MPPVGSPDLDSDRVRRAAGGLAAALLALAAGCAGPLPVPDLDELATAEEAAGFAIAGVHPVEPPADPAGPAPPLADHAGWLAAARARGALAEAEWATGLAAGGDALERLALRGLAEGPVAALELWFERPRFHPLESGESVYGTTCRAAVFHLRPLAGDLEAQLDALDLVRGPLRALWPERGGALYATDRDEVHVLIRGGDPAGPAVGAVARGPIGWVCALVGAEPWARARRRIAAAARFEPGFRATGDLLAALAATPFGVEPELAEGLEARYRALVEERFAAAEERLDRAADLGARVDAAHALGRLAEAGAVLPDGERFAARVAERLEPIADLIEATAAEARSRGARATAGGWLLALHHLRHDGRPGRVTVGEVPDEADRGAPALARARAALAGLVRDVVPGVETPRPFAAVDALYGEEGGFLAATPLGRLSGLVTGPRADYVAAAARPLALEVAGDVALELDVETSTRRRRRRYRVESDAHARWLAGLDRLRAELARWRAVVEETADHTRVVREPRRLRLDVDEEAKARHLEAQERVAALEEEAAALGRAEPPRHAWREATYPVEVQRWRGSARRELAVRRGDEAAAFVQDRPVDEVRERTAGWDGAGTEAEPDDHVAPSDAWATRAEVAAEVVADLDRQAGALVVGLVHEEVAAALARLEGEERAWAEYLLGRRPAREAPGPTALLARGGEDR